MAIEVREHQADESRPEQTRAGRVYRPHVDIIEGDELVLLADMPGVKSDAIDIHFEDGILTVRGNVTPRYADDTRFLLQEYGIGDYYRTFRVSEQVDASKIRAEYRDGVLTVFLPKAEEAKPRKIVVQAAG